MLQLRALPSQMTFFNPSSRYYRLTRLHVRSIDRLDRFQSPSFPFFASSPPLASLRSRTPKIHVGGPGSAVRSPSGVWSGAPTEIEFGALKIVALKYEIWWQVGNSFNYFFENQLTKLAHLVQLDKLTYD